MYQLKALQNENKAEQLLEMVRSLPSYNNLVFPTLRCVHSNREGDVLVVLRPDSLLLISKDGEEVSLSPVPLISSFRSQRLR